MAYLKIYYIIIAGFFFVIIIAHLQFTIIFILVIKIFKICDSFANISGQRNANANYVTHLALGSKILLRPE